MNLSFALLVALAAGPRLDADVAVMPPDAPLVVLVPRLGAVLEPVLDGLSRLRAHPAIAAALEPITGAINSRAGVDLFSPKAHARLGLDLSGAAWFAGGADGALALPFAKSGDATDYVGAILGIDPIKSGAGYQAAGLWFQHGEGRAVFGYAPEVAAPWFAAKRSPGADPLAGCPRGPGEADLFVRAQSPIGGTACATVRFDPDRVRLDARYASPLTEGWFGAADNRLLAGLPANPAAVFSTQLGPNALKRLRAAATKRQLSAFAAGFDGRISAAAGPGPKDFHLRLGLNAQAAPTVPADLVAALGDAVEARWRPDRKQVALFDAKSGDAVGTLTRAAHTLELTSSKAAPTGDLRAALQAPGRVDAALAQKASLLLYLRLGGVPHDGQPFLDAVLPALQFMELPSETFQPLAGAAAWTMGHISELAIALWVQEGALHLAIEGVHL